MVIKRYQIKIDKETADIGTAGELMVALDVLQGHRDRMVLEQLHSHLAKIISGPEDLYKVIRSLNPDDQVYLIEGLSSNLVKTVQSAGNLRDIFATLSDYKVEEKIIQTLGSDGLKTLIRSAEELSEVLEWVYGNCDQMVLDSLGVDYLKHLIQNGYELSLVLHSLDQKCQEGLIGMLGWEDVGKLVIDRRDLAHLLRALPGELSKRLLNDFTKEKLWKIIRDKYGWQYLHKYLEADEAEYLEKVLEVKHA
ncbi:MAG: hypothetical protein HWN67_02610 [Candidatus Helarchaeota archaeon]|nr:hypothetical protein [Candidatus Helarchaeota archaeon]